MSIKFDIYVLIVVECDFCIVIKWLMNPLLLFVSFSLSLLLGNCRYLGTPVTSDIPIIERRYAKKKLKMIRLSIIYNFGSLFVCSHVVQPFLKPIIKFEDTKRELIRSYISKNE